MPQRVIHGAVIELRLSGSLKRHLGSELWRLWNNNLDGMAKRLKGGGAH